MARHGIRNRPQALHRRRLEKRRRPRRPHRPQSSQREPDRRGALRDGGRPRRGARSLSASVAGMALDRRREARRDPAQGGSVDARANRRHRGDDDSGAGQDPCRGQSRSARVGPVVRLVRGGDQARLRPHARPSRGSAFARDPPAGRPDCDLHAVELPDLSAREEGFGSACSGLHRHLAPAARNSGRGDRAVPGAR